MVYVGFRKTKLLKFLDIKEAKKYIRLKTKEVPLHIILEA